MELHRTWLCPSPDEAGQVRLCGEVGYRDGCSEVWWFEFPAALADQVSSTGNPWLAALLPLAVHRQEALRLNLPVDAQLLRQAEPLMQVWASWFPHLRPIRIDAAADAPTTTGTKTASCFSGGVDSFHTLLEHQAAAADGPAIDELVCVRGFDLQVEKTAEFRRMAGRLERAAAAFGLPLLTPATNLRRTRYGQLLWGLFGHGPAIAALFLALENRWGAAYLPGSCQEATLFPWGSHPATTPLFSTAGFTLIHDGVAVDRVQKTERVAESPAALAALHVCWQDESDRNCGRCEKCQRTMATLDLLGKLKDCPTFPADAYDPARLHRLFVPSLPTDVMVEEVESLAQRRGRPEIAAELARCRQRSAWIRKASRLGFATASGGRIGKALSRRLTKLLVYATGSVGRI